MAQSWNSIRKRLEQDFLCDKLKGRVQYFFTIYHGAPDHYGRFAVRVDGIEMFRANPYNEGYQDRIARQIKLEQNIPEREWTGKEFLNEEKNLVAEEKASAQAISHGIATTWDVSKAIEDFLLLPIEKALMSDNDLIRMLAILDRRVGKRMLIRLSKNCDDLPQWLKYFYWLRFEVEGITE